MKLHRNFRIIPPRLPPESGSPQDSELLTRFNSEVTARFEKLTDLQTVTDLVCDPKSSSIPDSRRTAHPCCAPYADTEYCRKSWNAHLAQLKQRPEVHWHRCGFGLYCALVPVAVRGRCVAVCQLVCPQSCTEQEFELKVELLDVLVEGFAANESESQAESDTRHGGGDLARFPPPGPGRQGDPQVATPPHVLAAVSYIDQHLTDCTLTVASIARALSVNSSYLAHLFSQHLGVRMSHYIALHRIERAKHLLSTTDWQIKRIAFETGHSNRFWFSEVFHDQTGCTPTQFRRQLSPGSAPGPG